MLPAMLSTVFARADVKLETCNFLVPGVAIPHTLAGGGYARLDRVPPEGLSEGLVGPNIISFCIKFAKSTGFSGSVAPLARLIGLQGLPYRA